jgi:hypothetical protein
MRALAIVSFFGLGLAACNETPAPTVPTGPVPDTVSPKESPMQYKVLSDVVNTQANTVEYHVLVADQPKHDDVEQLLKFLYRHLMTRREPTPGSMEADVYSNEAQYKTPPRSPIASVTQKSGELGLRQQGAARVLAAGERGAGAGHRQGLEAGAQGRA